VSSKTADALGLKHRHVRRTVPGEREAVFDFDFHQSPTRVNPRFVLVSMTLSYPCSPYSSVLALPFAKALSVFPAQSAVAFGFMTLLYL
jgi:hypothetical protein